MTKAQARSLANECVNTLIDAGVLEEQRDFFALDLMTESICTAYAHHRNRNHTPMNE